MWEDWKTERLEDWKTGDWKYIAARGPLAGFASPSVYCVLASFMCLCLCCPYVSPVCVVPCKVLRPCPSFLSCVVLMCIVIVSFVLLPCVMCLGVVLSICRVVLSCVCYMCVFSITFFLVVPRVLYCCICVVFPVTS